jgi:hypothetical protein
MASDAEHTPSRENRGLYNPFRDNPFVRLEELQRLERDNARLRATLLAAFFLLALLAALAGWWFGLLCRLR